jgi:PAS domain S-box-containing protein
VTIERTSRARALAATVEASPIATVLTNPRLPDNPVVAANHAFCELTGYPKSEILGRNCRFLAGEATEPWQTQLVRDAIASLKPSLTELLNYRKDGSSFRNALLIAPLFDAGGAVEYFIGSQVQVGEGSAPPLVMRERRAAHLLRSLSRRQREVLREMAAGHPNKQIAWRLSISEKTVKMHRGLALQKLGVRTSADAIRLAVEAGL